MGDYFADLEGHYPVAVREIDLERDAQRQVATKLNFVYYNLWLLMVQPRHFLLLANDAAYTAVNWAGFTGIPFSLAFTELRDLWIFSDLVFRAATIAEYERAHYGSAVWDTPEGRAVEHLKLSGIRECRDITVWMGAFQVQLPRDDGAFPGTFINPNLDQLEHALQRTCLWQSSMTTLCQAAAHLSPAYVYAVSLNRSTY